jgi:hypothetical protein
MEASAILLPVFVMGLLTVAMMIWMIATRLPAMTAAGMDAQDARDTSVLKSLPPKITGIADNYNHLFEQPTVFYEVCRKSGKRYKFPIGKGFTSRRSALLDTDDGRTIHRRTEAAV